MATGLKLSTGVTGMAKRTRTARSAQQKAYTVEAEWTAADLALLEELKRAEAALPADAPRALLSVRLSVLTEDTTSPSAKSSTFAARP